MQDKVESIIKKVLKNKALVVREGLGEHPEDGIFACYLEGKLESKEEELFRKHVTLCPACSLKLSLDIQSSVTDNQDIPAKLQESICSSLGLQDKDLILEIALKVKDKIIEIINTTGEVLVGQELVAAPLLRSRQIKDFKDEVTILKDFKNLVVEVKLENKSGKFFDAAVLVKKKDTLKTINDLRVTLYKQGVELESYIASTGMVTFENILLGKYRIEISGAKDKFASIALEVKT
jgi:hypothetical protein